jgi:hypothetical protein
MAQDVPVESTKGWKVTYHELAFVAAMDVMLDVLGVIGCK